MKFDLHCHSQFSDGLLMPDELVDYAVEREVEYLALTDHDTVSGLSMAKAHIEFKGLPIQLIDGVEISTLTEFGEIHVVGLGIDPQQSELIQALTEQQSRRWQRAIEIADKLAKLGADGVLEWLQQNVKQVVTRSHIARALVELNHVKDISQAFKKYIGKKGRVKVAKNWIQLADSIELIHRAGGMAVLAHPTRYPLSNRKLGLLIGEFAVQSGDAIEIAYPSLNKDKMEWLKLHCLKNNLLASSGSDFHYPNMRWTDLGRFPSLDGLIPHVITDLVA